MKQKIRAEYEAIGGSPDKPLPTNSFLKIIIVIAVLAILTLLFGNQIMKIVLFLCIFGSTVIEGIGTLASMSCEMDTFHYSFCAEVMHEELLMERSF